MTAAATRVDKISVANTHVAVLVGKLSKINTHHLRRGVGFCCWSPSVNKHTDRFVYRCSVLPIRRSAKAQAGRGKARHGAKTPAVRKIFDTTLIG